MAYVPKPRSKKRFISLFFSIIIGVSLLVSGVLLYVQNQNQETKSFLICGLNEEKSKAKIDQVYAETYAISDYFFYGENLNLYAKDYQLGEKDDMNRKSVELVNLCDGESYTYTMEAYVDRQIDVSELSDGFYEVFVNDNLVKKRLVYDEEVTSDPFTSIARQDQVKAVQLFANPEITNHMETAPQENYLFLSVESETPNSDDVDIFLDPYGYMMQNGVLVPDGEGNGLKEYEESYQAALLLKAALEEKGVRVAISKDRATEVVPYYGEDGRIQRAYASNARYYIELGLNTSTQAAYRGTELYHSNYTSETFANALLYDLKKNTQLIASNVYTWNERSEGVLSPSLAQGVDGLKIYDINPVLRESGGRATGAARFNEDAKTNASFAQGHIGMQAISLNLFYLSNAEDVAYWKEDKATIMNEFANALVKTMRIQE